MIENDGLFGDCSGDIGLKRDENVFVDGTPVLVGFTDESKTKFAICPVYGELTSHYSKLDEIFYKQKTIKKGEVLSAKVTFLKDEKPIRLLCQPEGQSATFTMAAHADAAKTPIARAIFWGVSDTTSSDYGKLGMLSNDIAGTLSVFTDYTEQWRDADALEVRHFKKLIDDAYNHGMEICPHTITFHPDTRLQVEKALPYLHDNYFCRNWIDHFLRKNNESVGLHSSGNNSLSPFYIMDLMQEYGYQYCWSYIDTTPDKATPKDQLWPEHFMFPRHLVFQNEKLTFPNGKMMWQYKNTWKQLERLVEEKEYDPVCFMQDLIDNCGVWTEHCYLIGTYGIFYTEDKKKRIFTIHPKLEALFEFIREQKMKGNVWNPTQSEFCDYMVQLQHIEITRTAPREYKIVNNNADSVNCTFFCQDNVKYYLDGVSLKKIKHKNGTIAAGKIKVGVSHLKLSLEN